MSEMSSRVETYEEFFASPIERGRFWWVEEGVELFFQYGEKRGQHVAVYVNHAPGDWGKRGDVQGWNGDLDRPTLSPSIQTSDWHGYFVEGEVRDA